jgi:hypothetical protein
MKTTLLMILFSGILMSEYSIQVGTFSKFEEAEKYLSKFNKDFFVYQTDSGYWTVRFGIETSRAILEQMRKKAIFKEVQNGVIVPTDVSKVNFRNSLTNSIFSRIERTYNQIDTITFHIKIEDKIYKIQITEYPYSEMANLIFDEKIKISDLNSIIISNNIIHLYISYKELDISQNQIKKYLSEIMELSKKNREIRTKIYQLNKL